MVRKFFCKNEAYFNSLFNSLEEGILLLKAIDMDDEQILDFVITGLNKTFEEIIGISREHIIGRTIREVYPALEPKWFDILENIVTSEEKTQSDIHFDTVDKHFKVKFIIPEKDNIIIFFNDITEKMKADEFLEKHFILFENAQDIILYLKSDGSIIDANKTAVEKYGYSYLELLNMNIQQLRHSSMMVKYNEQMEISLSKGIVFEGCHLRKDGTSFPVEVSSRSIDVKGELLRIHIIRDITDRKEAEEKITYLANYDTLTGIANRGFLMRQFKDTLQLSAQGNLKFAVMLFDLDKFKTINDVHGHNAGDEVLRTAARRLQQAVKSPHIVGRLGGDEFLVIQKIIEDIGEAHDLAERIIDSLCKPVEVGSNKLDLYISLGIAIYPDVSKSIEGLIHCADTAMYSVKQNGGGSYKIY